MKHYLGVSAGYHDAAVSVIRDDGEILFAAHSERYSKIKNDSEIHESLLQELTAWQFDVVAFYEKPWLHNIQQFYSGQHHYLPWTTHGRLQKHLGNICNWAGSRVSFSHHLSHAAAGFQTSSFDQAAVVVIDAIGELDTISIYQARYDQRGQACYKRLWRQTYPHSIGLFYSAITSAVNLKPMEEEYITMGMAAYGDRSNHKWMAEAFVSDMSLARFQNNYHVGIDHPAFESVSSVDIAAGAQYIVEHMVDKIAEFAAQITGSNNLVYMGGVALNCVANSLLGRHFDNIWIMPNPGDAGSSLGAAALAYGKRLNWQGAYLGHEIPGVYPVDHIIHELEQTQICGVASGRAEWGPRALGNRSLLADPRGPDIKDRVNTIKQRQKFRPFAPVILEEVVNQYFDMPQCWDRSRYMQVTAHCQRPDLFPAIVHVDGTSRVQTVPQDGSGIRQLLEAWYNQTGCPMLLNTSLNIRGEPMVNDRADADRFQSLYGIKVCS
jgi:carbamoyltransferase